MSELDDLGKKIAKAKHSRETSPENLNQGTPETKQDMSFGMRVGVELFAGILVGSGIGYAIDYFAHTLPFFLIIFMIVGAGAGFWSIYKSFFRCISQGRMRSFIAWLLFVALVPALVHAAADPDLPQLAKYKCVLPKNSDGECPADLIKDTENHQVKIRSFSLKGSAKLIFVGGDAFLGVHNYGYYVLLLDGEQIYPLLYATNPSFDMKKELIFAESVDDAEITGGKSQTYKIDQAKHLAIEIDSSSFKRSADGDMTYYDARGKETAEPRAAENKDIQSLD